MVNMASGMDRGRVRLRPWSLILNILLWLIDTCQNKVVHLKLGAGSIDKLPLCDQLF